MIHLKMLGGTMVIGAGSIAACCLAAYEKKKLTVLDAWIDLIFHIRGQIDCYLMPLDEILACADSAILKGCMCRTPHPDLPALLRTSSPYLSEESKRLITAFTKEIGGSYREEQLKRCDYYIHALRAIREKLAEDLPSRIKMTVSLCICASIAAAILLW